MCYCGAGNRCGSNSKRMCASRKVRVFKGESVPLVQASDFIPRRSVDRDRREGSIATVPSTHRRGPHTEFSQELIGQADVAQGRKDAGYRTRGFPIKVNHGTRRAVFELPEDAACERLPVRNQIIIQDDQPIPVVIDRAETGSPANFMNLRFRTPAKLSLENEVATAKLGRTVLAIAPLFRSSGKATLAGLATCLALAILWWAMDLPAGWGVNPGPMLLYLAIGLTVVMLPKHLHDARFPITEPDRP